MKLRGDELGMLWEDPVVSTRVVVQGPMPKSDWVAPHDFPEFRKAKRLAIDTETCDPDLSALGPGVRRDGYVVGISIAADGLEPRYYPIRHDAGGNLDEDMVLEWFRYEMARFKGELVGAHLLYDLDYLTQEGVNFSGVKRYLDVQNAEPLLDENALSYSLDRIALDRLGRGKDETLLERALAAHGYKGKNHLWRLPARFVGPYAEEDAALPLEILAAQEPLLAAEDLGNVFDLESRLIPLLLAMRRRGVRINVGKAEEAREALVKKRAEVFATLGTDDVWSAESLAPLFDAKGIEYPLTPKTKKPSITKPWLEAQQDPFAGLVRDARRYDKTIGTFFDGHILGHHVNGKIHCQFNQLKSDEGGAVSGRFSSSDPNLQQITARDEELTPIVRGVFVPDDDEQVWVQHDYSQIEYRKLVHYARGQGADEARARYHTDPDTDFHAMCGEMASISNRKQVKNVNFGVVYGAGAKTTAVSMGVSEEEAHRFIKRYDEALPFVRDTSAWVQEAAGKRGWIKTISGRRRRFNMWERRNGKPGIKPEAEAREEWGDLIRRAMTYSALNSLLQGGAADVMKKGMVDVWESGVCDALGGPPLLTVHDELDWSVPPDCDEALAEVQNLMESAYELRVPIVVDEERGPNWGALE